MAPTDHNMTLTDSLMRCLTQTSAQERHDQWQALTAAFSAEEIADALSARYTSQQEALQRKQAMLEERQTLLNAYLGRELPDESAEAPDRLENMDFLRQQVKGYERQFVQLQQQAREAQGVLDGIAAQRDEAQAWNVELTKLYEQSQEALIQSQRQEREALAQLDAAIAERDAAAAMNVELMERLSDASLRSAQMASEVARLEKLTFVRLHNRLHQRK